MTVLSRDHWTGSYVNDIHGRTPDGGGEVGLQEGEWALVTGSAPNGARLQIARSLNAWNYFRLYDTTNDEQGIEANNVASLTLDSDPLQHLFPADIQLNDLLVLLVGSSDGRRSPEIPFGWEEGARAGGGSGNAEIAAFYKKATGFENGGDDITVTFFGLGETDSIQMMQLYAFKNAEWEDPLDGAAATTTWGSQDDLGPIPGPTPTVPRVLVIACGIKQNEWADDNEVGADHFIHVGEAPESTLANDAAMTLMWRIQDTADVPPDCTMKDASAVTRPGAGCGFMVCFKLIEAPPTPVNVLRYRHFPQASHSNTPYYVNKNITGMGEDHYSQVEFTYWPTTTNDDVILTCRCLDSAITCYRVVLSETLSAPLGEMRIRVHHVTAGSQFVLGIPQTNLGLIEWGVKHKLALCVSGHDGTIADPIVIRVFLDGTMVYLTEINDAAHVLNDGYPGIAMHSDRPAGAGYDQQMDNWEGGDLCSPCTSTDPPNPYPDPPPVPPVPPGLWVRQNDSYRFLPLEDLRARQNISERQALDETSIYYNMAYRPLIAEDEFDPEPNHPMPPGYDPCDTLPDIPPPGTVDPVPLDDRMFGLASMPTTLLGDLFNGTSQPAGPWTPLELSKALARGGMILASQGSYQHFFDSNGHYSRAIYEAYVMNTLVRNASLLEDMQDAGALFGYSTFDDFAGAQHWPPSGISEAEITYIVAFIRSHLPFLRIGLRARPSQLSSHCGLNFVTCAYRYWGNPAPAIWRNAELAKANAIGLPEILWALNTSKGGRTNRADMTPADIIEAGLVLAELPDKNAGIISWHYTTGWDSQPGILDAWATVRNELALLPPP